jgi:hypothetical protein
LAHHFHTTVCIIESLAWNNETLGCYSNITRFLHDLTSVETIAKTRPLKFDKSGAVFENQYFGKNCPPRVWAGCEFGSWQVYAKD